MALLWRGLTWTRQAVESIITQCVVVIGACGTLILKRTLSAVQAVGSWWARWYTVWVHLTKRLLGRQALGNNLTFTIFLT